LSTQHDDDDYSETLPYIPVGGILQEAEGEGMIDVDATRSVTSQHSLYG
jgi:hypothetical protein